MIPLSNRSSNLSGSAPFDGNQWGVILAGGDGVRLRPLIRKITGLFIGLIGKTSSILSSES